MFRGDNRALGQTMALAVACTHDLAHPRVGSEHLLLALAARPGEIANILARHGPTPRRSKAPRSCVHLLEPAQLQIRTCWLRSGLTWTV